MVQQLLLSSMKSAVDILCDDAPENDYLKFYSTPKILLIAGYKLDALSAVSLYGPKERYSEVAVLDMICDGRTNYFEYSDSILACCPCVDAAFRSKCLEELRTGAFRCLLCSANHEWLCIPAWDEEFKETGNGFVRAGGERRDGKRVGGNIVLVEEWVDSIREEWGIEKPIVDAKAKEDMQAL